MYNIALLVSLSEDVKEYIESSRLDAPKFIERYESYALEKEMVSKIKCHFDNYIIFAFSAEWCSDCVKNIPILANLQDQTGLVSRVFGHLILDAKSSSKKWRIPPSPGEVELFNVTKTPSIYILDKQGNKVGEIIENPQQGKTLEAAILDVIES